MPQYIQPVITGYVPYAEKVKDNEMVYKVREDYPNPGVLVLIEIDILNLEDKLSRLSPASDPTTVVLRELLQDMLRTKQALYDEIEECENRPAQQLS